MMTRRGLWVREKSRCSLRMCPGLAEWVDPDGATHFGGGRGAEGEAGDCRVPVCFGSSFGGGRTPCENECCFRRVTWTSSGSVWVETQLGSSQKESGSSGQRLEPEGGT